MLSRNSVRTVVSWASTVSKRVPALYIFPFVLLVVVSVASTRFCIVSEASTGSVSDATVSIGSPSFSYLVYENSTEFIEDGTSTMSSTVYNFVSYVNFTYTVTPNQTSNLSSRAIFDGYINVTFNHAIPSIAAFTTYTVRAEVLSSSWSHGTTTATVIKGSESNASSQILIGLQCNDYNVSGGGTINLKVTYSLRANTATSNPATVIQTLPTGSCSLQSASFSYATLDEFDPEYRLKYGFYDNQGNWVPGWYSTFNTQFGTMNSWLQTISGKVDIIDTRLGYTNNYLLNIKNNTDIIVDYIQQTAAADVVEDANDNFVDNAADFESAQAVIELAADDDFNAVDMDVSLLGTYSQSMSFWMRCVNALPTIAGSLWEVLVFGFLIAFLIFILRLVR